MNEIFKQLNMIAISVNVPFLVYLLSSVVKAHERTGTLKEKLVWFGWCALGV